MVMVFAVFGGMRMRIALRCKKQSRHQDHKGLYEWMLDHSEGLLFNNIGQCNALTTLKRDSVPNCGKTELEKWIENPCQRYSAMRPMFLIAGAHMARRIAKPAKSNLGRLGFQRPF